MPRSRPPRRKVLVPVKGPLIPADTPPRIRQLALTIAVAVARAASHLTHEEKAAALYLCGFDEASHIDDAVDRANFLRGVWAGHAEMTEASKKHRVPGAASVGGCDPAGLS